MNEYDIHNIFLKQKKKIKKKSISRIGRVIELQCICDEILFEYTYIAYVSTPSSSKTTKNKTTECAYTVCCMWTKSISVPL